MTYNLKCFPSPKMPLDHESRQLLLSLMSSWQNEEWIYIQWTGLAWVSPAHTQNRLTADWLFFTLLWLHRVVPLIYVYVDVHVYYIVRTLAVLVVLSMSLSCPLHNLSLFLKWSMLRYRYTFLWLIQFFVFFRMWQKHDAFVVALYLNVKS